MRPREGWWSWKPCKVALETLFAAGILLVSRRESFQRYYDLAERVIPPWVDTTEPTEEERVRFFVARTMRALGAIKPRDVHGYYHQWCTKIGKGTKELQAILDAMAAGGEVVKVTVDGEGQPYYTPRRTRAGSRNSAEASDSTAYGSSHTSTASCGSGAGS
jgi:hypothetical protein